MHSKRDDKKKKDSNSLTEIRFLKVFYCQKALNEAHKMHLPRKELSLSELKKKLIFFFSRFSLVLQSKLELKAKKKLNCLIPTMLNHFEILYCWLNQKWKVFKMIIYWKHLGNCLRHLNLIVTSTPEYKVPLRLQSSEQKVLLNVSNSLFPNEALILAVGSKTKKNKFCNMDRLLHCSESSDHIKKQDYKKKFYPYFLLVFGRGLREKNIQCQGKFVD